MLIYLCCYFQQQAKGRFLGQWQLRHSKSRKSHQREEWLVTLLYYYWSNCVTTQCGCFIETANSASECLPILAHTHLSIHLFSILSGNSSYKRLQKEKKVKVIVRQRAFLLVITGIFKTEIKLKTEKICSHVCFYFQISRNWRFPGM